MNITIVAGARPNFMKIAPIIEEIKNAKSKGFLISYNLVHTGQHFDKNMSDSFFEQLGIPHPDINLECGGGNQSEQAGNIMVKFEKYLASISTDLVLVVGDVTSTMACAIVAKKLQIKVAHVEGGIRSGDMGMPEEINRIVTDSISDYFFTTSVLANNNLLKSGVSEEAVFFVGNTMIDTLVKNLPRIKQPAFWGERKLSQKNYIVLTLHRPSNVDDLESLRVLMNEIASSNNNLPIVFPVHPRTKRNLDQINFLRDSFVFVDPMNYLEFIYLIKNSKVIVTDSGGITEEATVLGVPCMTLRTTTERPETVTIGTNELIGINPAAIPPALKKVFDGNWKKGGIPDKWDGKASERIVVKLLEIEL